MNRRILSREAERDLRNIHEFIADRNPAAADRIISRLEIGMSLLLANPAMGRKRPELADNLRSFRVEGYLIYYYPAADGIEIARIAHGSRDAGRLFP